MTQAEFLQQPWDVVWMAADNAAHLFPVSLRFLEGFEQAAAHRLACNAVQRFLGERIAVRFQRTLRSSTRMIPPEPGRMAERRDIALWKTRSCVASPDAAS